MPYSYDYFKNDVKRHLVKVLDKDTAILDVGPGAGTYAALLGDTFKNIDAVEIFEPYIEKFGLTDLYKNVYSENILYFDYSQYDYIIFGDVIEHLSYEDAFAILNDTTQSEIKCLVAVPYQMGQGPVGGNHYEIHLQDELTHDIFLTLYPMMRVLYKNDYYGYYINYT